MLQDPELFLFVYLHVQLISVIFLFKFFSFSCITVLLCFLVDFLLYQSRPSIRLLLFLVESLLCVLGAENPVQVYALIT